MCRSRGREASRRGLGEQLTEVGAGGGGKLFERLVAQRRQKARGVGDISGLAGLAPVRNGCEERRIGLDQQLFQRQRFGCFRSEEHTSELQSLLRISYAVFCLKKK